MSWGTRCANSILLAASKAKVVAAERLEKMGVEYSRGWCPSAATFPVHISSESLQIVNMYSTIVQCILLILLTGRKNDLVVEGPRRSSASFVSVPGTLTGDVVAGFTPNSQRNIEIVDIQDMSGDW